MRPNVLRSTALALAALALAACNGDRATGVVASAAPAASIVSTATTLIHTVGLRRLTPMNATVTVTKVIDRTGGSFTVPTSGLTVTVAPGAVSVPTTFSAVAYAGTVVGYEFAPHQAFAAPVTLTQDLVNTNGGALIKSGVFPQAAYFADRSQVDWSTGDASVSELLTSSIDVTGLRMTTNVYHFSGYLMSSGRQ